MSTIPTRIDVELFESARNTGESMSRSAAQQLTHWARIGRELEASSSTRVRDIRRVLAGTTSYDDLAERDQAIVRVMWEEDMTARSERLDLAEEFAQAGQSWAELDDKGDVIERRPSAS